MKHNLFWQEESGHIYVQPINGDNQHDAGKDASEGKLLYYSSCQSSGVRGVVQGSLDLVDYSHEHMILIVSD
jgi:hypothetical protein